MFCQGGMECDSKPCSISLAIAGPENNVLFTVDGGLTDTLRACSWSKAAKIMIGFVCGCGRPAARRGSLRNQHGTA